MPDYSLSEHQVWGTLYSRMRPEWERYANPHFLQGLDSLCFAPDRIPQLTEVNQFLSPLTGFSAREVAGYVPAFQFFDSLRRREFPTTVTIRGAGQLDYLPEPDIFHDIAGHVPMHTDPAFAEALVRFGECAHRAAEIRDPVRLANIVKGMARFFWFTVEFGLMESQGGWKAYGSGLLSSHGELAHAIRSPQVQRFPFQVEWVINQSFAIDRYQPLLFTVRNFEELYDLVGQLDRWMQQGKLDHIAPGEPGIREEDLQSFLDAGR